MKPIEVVVLGAGGRGFHTYGDWILRHPDRLQVVGVAEPDPERRARFAAAHRLSPEQTFVDHRELFAGPQLGQALINTTMDQQHVETTLGALAAGYDKNKLIKSHPRVGVFPFDSKRKLMSTLHESSGHVVVYVKGAPEAVLPLCSLQYGDGPA